MDTAYDTMIEQIAQTIFSTMLEIDAFRVDQLAPPDHDLLLATVHIAGQWTGSVVLGLSPTVSRRAAAVMLRMPEPEVTHADEREVASELVNMIGGNLKSVLPGPSFLSLPTIVAGREFGLQVRDAEVLEDVVLACDHGLLLTRLYRKATPVAGNG